VSVGDLSYSFGTKKSAALTPSPRAARRRIALPDDRRPRRPTS
jgi:hypothetical protein